MGNQRVDRVRPHPRGAPPVPGGGGPGSARRGCHTDSDLARLTPTSVEWNDGDALFLRFTLWRQPAENVNETITIGSRVDQTALNGAVEGAR